MKSDKITSRTVSLKSLERPLYLKFCFSFFSSIGNKSTLTIAVMFTDRMCTLSKLFLRREKICCYFPLRRFSVTLSQTDGNTGTFRLYWLWIVMNWAPTNSGKIFFICDKFYNFKLNFRWIVSRSICKSKHKSKQWIWFRLKRSTRTRNHSTSSHLLRLCYPASFTKKKNSRNAHST